MKDDAFKDKVGKYFPREIGSTEKERKARSLKWSKLYMTKSGTPDNNFDMEDDDLDTESELKEGNETKVV